MINSILQEMNSPTLERESPRDSGTVLYETVTNKDGNTFNVIIDFFMTSRDTCEYSYTILSSEHSIPVSHLIEMVQIIIERSEGRILIFQ